MKEREVNQFIQEQGLSFCGLIESKVKECKKEGVLNAIGRSWNVFCNYGSSPNGRIWLCWNPRDVDIIFISHSDQVIHCRVLSSSKTWSCVVSVVYWDNCRVRRTELWADIEASLVGFRVLYGCYWVTSMQLESGIKPWVVLWIGLLGRMTSMNAFLGQGWKT